MEGPAEKRQKLASDHKAPLPHVLTRTLKVAGQPKSPRDDGQRSVRPRPLHVAEQVLLLALPVWCVRTCQLHAAWSYMGVRLGSLSHC